MSVEPLFFQKINHKTFVKYEIQNLEYLVVGGEKGAEIEIADIPQQKYPDGVPYIPGSTVKGVARHLFTQVVTALRPNELKDNFKTDKALTNEKDIEELLKKNTDDLIKEIEVSLNGTGKIGIVDLLFGSSVMASPLIFTDAIGTKRDIGTRTHVRIDTDKESALKHGLVQVEAVKPNNIFQGMIIFNCIDVGTEPTVLHNAFEMLLKILENNSIFMGGWKSRGYGLVKLKIVGKKECTPLQIIKGEC
jgi:CRISPR-associated RAMP protein (TIGR02581 family)